MIICCGEALVDMLPIKSVCGASGFAPHAGGAVFNTAVALGRLGECAGMLSGMSSDQFGVQLRKTLHDSNVDTSFCVISHRPTTLAFVQINDGQADYDFFDENSAGRMVNIGDFPAIQSGTRALFFGGISLACEPGAGAYEALLERESSRRAIMIDPNIRPGLVRNEERYRTRLTRMIARADIVKVSDEDLDWIDPTPVSQEDKARALLGAGPSVVVLTQGRDGATGYLASGERICVPSKKVEVVDTVGAGDTFNAGFLAKLSELGLLGKLDVARLSSAALASALKHGARAAAVTVSRTGANPPWAHEL